MSIMMGQMYLETSSSVCQIRKSRNESITEISGVRIDANLDPLSGGRSLLHVVYYALLVKTPFNP